MNCDKNSPHTKTKTDIEKRRNIQSTQCGKTNVRELLGNYGKSDSLVVEPRMKEHGLGRIRKGCVNEYGRIVGLATSDLGRVRERGAVLRVHGVGRVTGLSESG
jgi:hypothetical protein